VTPPLTAADDDPPELSSQTCTRRSMLGGLAATGLATAAPASGALAGQSQQQGGSGQQGQAADGPLADPDAFEAFLDGVMGAHLDAHDIAGATVSVVDGSETFAKGYGYADVEARESVDADETMFRIGSVSKLFAWTAVMQGVERGDLALDVDVNEYLDDVEVPDAYDDPITLDHLATHTPGFEERARGTFAPDADSLEPLATVLREEQPARVRPPGELAAYSNYGAALAGHIAARAGGQSFDEYVDAEIFEPLGMDRSTFAQPVPDDHPGTLSKGYTPAGDTFEAGEFEYVGVPPAGSMSATATDVVSFMRAHLGDGSTDAGRVLSAESTEAMHERRFTHHDRLNGMCFGFYEQSRNGVRAIAHGGDTDLFHSLLFLIPEEDVGLFVSYNSPGGVPAREELVDAFFEQYYPTDEETPQNDGKAPTRASALTGTYRAIRMPYTTSEKYVGATGTTSVSVDDQGRLVTSLLGGETQRWVQVDPLYFEEVGGEDALAFLEDDGEITHLAFGNLPPLAFERIGVYEQTMVHLAVLGVSLLVFLSALFGWPVSAGWRRYRGVRRSGAESLARYGRWVGGVAAAAFVAFWVVFGGFVLTDPTGLLFGDPLAFQLLLLLPLVGAIATVGAVGLAVVAWRDGYWGRWSRLHYSLVALAAVAMVLVLGYWNLLWYQM